MSQASPNQILTFLSAAAIGARRAVKLNTTAEQAVVATDATGRLLGLTYDSATAAGQEIGVVVSGTAKATAAGTIARGAAVTATTGGAVIATTTAEDYILGYALQSAVSGDVFEVQLAPDGHVPTA